MMSTRKSASAAMLCGLLVVSSRGICAAQRGSAGYLPQLYAGQRALGSKQWSAAASHFRQALMWDQKGAEAHIGLANVYLKQGKPDKALEEFTIGLRLKPHSAEAERGIHAARSPESEEAAFKSLEQQVQAEPNNADARTTYAEELLERKRFDEAKREAETALRLNPKAGHAYCALGRVQAAQGQIEDAKKNLAIAIKYDNSDDDAFNTLGDMAFEAKDFKTALKYYGRVVAILPLETEGHRELRETYRALGDDKGVAREQRILDSLAVKP